MKKPFTLILFIIFSIISLTARQIKVLAIGNSFSQDAVENYLWELANANGDTIIIGNMYIGGCALERHYLNSISGSTDYSYRKVKNGELTKTEGYTLKEAFQDEKWDYVSFQQVSQLSGMPETYFPYIDSLIVFARKHTNNPQLKILLHAMWAYARDSKHSGFAFYGNNQLTMFRSIVNAVLYVAGRIGADFIVPSGTAIQNGRTSKLGDSFCRDGYHLELTYGRYTAACVWFEKLCGISAIGSAFRPQSITPFEAKIAQYAAHFAVRNPTRITSLTFRTDRGKNP